MTLDMDSLWSIAIFAIVGALGASGCAERLRAGVTLMQPQSSLERSSVELGDGRVLGRNVNPMDGVRLTAKEHAVVARFSLPRGPAESERLAPASLEATFQVRGTTDDGSPPPAGAHRIIVDGGQRVVVLGKSGDGEHAYRLMAEALDSADGLPRGSAVVVSPSGADVAGPVSAVALNDHVVVVGFAAATGGPSFSAYAVPLKAL